MDVIVFDKFWGIVAENFMAKKRHNVSHLKELGIIFFLPAESTLAGEKLQVFALLLHYLNEVPFYSALFKHYGAEAEFTAKLLSLLRGDVPEFKTEMAEPATVLIIQRYLAKDNPNDPRLAVPHINPEAEHWRKAMLSLEKISGFAGSATLDAVAGIFGEEVVSFNLMDVVVSLNASSSTRPTYHQSEALWNKLFCAHLGQERLDELIEEGILDGVVKFVVS